MSNIFTISIAHVEGQMKKTFTHGPMVHPAQIYLYANNVINNIFILLLFHYMDVVVSTSHFIYLFLSCQQDRINSDRVKVLSRCNNAILLTLMVLRTCIVKCDFKCHKKSWLFSLDFKIKLSKARSNKWYLNYGHRFDLSSKSIMLRCNNITLLTWRQWPSRVRFWGCRGYIYIYIFKKIIINLLFSYTSSTRHPKKKKIFSPTYHQAPSKKIQQHPQYELFGSATTWMALRKYFAEYDFKCHKKLCLPSLTN